MENDPKPTPMVWDAIIEQSRQWLQGDLNSHYWSRVQRARIGRWHWAVIDYQNNVMALGDAPDLAAAKGAVEAWDQAVCVLPEDADEPQPILLAGEDGLPPEVLP